MKKIIGAFILILCSENLHADSRRAEVVSMISLISSPERYKDKTVVVKGYFIYDFEYSAVYMYEDDFKFENEKNAFSLIFPCSFNFEYNKDATKKHVVVIGKFEPKNVDYLYSGSIVVDSLSLAEDVPGHSDEIYSSKKNCSIK